MTSHLSPTGPSADATLCTGGGTTDPHRGAGVDYEPGTLVGRYELRRQVGAGGMGVVYEAYDPELDRGVAVKLLHDAPGGSESRTGGQRRLLREAQAMARLAHPNVITVHDVGVHDDRVFVAMEFIEGQTLTQWRREVHDVQEILEVFARAAAGLQAAHDAGFVHRDFKPDNVMLGKGGELRVMDFGLARRTGAPAPVVPPTAASTSATLDETHTEGLAGTPAYMAPEQHAGRDITPRTDQFSFCVALFEALYGERPFAGETPAALAFEVLEGHVHPPPRAMARRVPRRVHHALLRGLSVDPEARFSSMRELIDALRPRRRRAPWIVASLVGVGGAAWVLGAGPPEATCDGAQRQMQSQWNDAARKRVHAGLANRPWSEDVTAATLEGLDAYADAWIEAGTGLCLQARDESISPRVFDLGMACLQPTQQRDDRLGRQPGRG